MNCVQSPGPPWSWSFFSREFLFSIKKFEFAELCTVFWSSLILVFFFKRIFFQFKKLNPWLVGSLLVRLGPDPVFFSRDFFSIKIFFNPLTCGQSPGPPSLSCFDMAAIAGPLGLLDSAPRPDIHCLLATSTAAQRWNNGIDTTARHCWISQVKHTVEKSWNNGIDTTACHYWISIVLKWNTPDGSIPEWNSQAEV